MAKRVAALEALSKAVTEAAAEARLQATEALQLSRSTKDLGTNVKEVRLA